MITITYEIDGSPESVILEENEIYFVDDGVINFITSVKQNKWVLQDEKAKRHIDILNKKNKGLERL